MTKLNRVYNYNNLGEAVNGFQKRGYTYDFLIPKDKECLYCQTHSLELSPDEFLLDEIYRFQEMSGLDKESILFAISSLMHHIKGLVINSFGANFEYRSSKLVEHLYKKSRQ